MISEGGVFSDEDMIHSICGILLSMRVSILSEIGCSMEGCNAACFQRAIYFLENDWHI